MIQKKIRSLIFAGLGLILCVLLCGGIGMTAKAELYGDFGYEENGSGITIAGYTGNKTELVIPGEINGKKVTSIGVFAFDGCSSLTSITIPDSVTSIGYGAFSGCSGLTSITIPDSVTSIDEWAFGGCSGLTSITIPGSVTSIGDLAFSGCSGLMRITVSKENKYYDSRNNCNAIIETESNTLVSGCKKTVIPDSVTSIGDYAFDGCSGLMSITIPYSVTSMGDFAFRYCSGLTSITVSKENEYYDSRNNCNAIIETRRNRLISGCKKTVIPDSVMSIEYGAFEGCSGLTSITIPDNVTSIENWAFDGCSGLMSITVSKGNEYYDSRNNCNAIIETGSNRLVKGCKKTVIPDSVTEIDSDAFSGCSGLTRITIPDSVTSIRWGAFKGCSGLTSITVSKGNKYYDSRDNCNAIIETESNTLVSGCKKTVIPDSVTSIGWDAFNGCSSLTSITIPDSVTSIGGMHFMVVAA